MKHVIRFGENGWWYVLVLVLALVQILGGEGSNKESNGGAEETACARTALYGRQRAMSCALTSMSQPQPQVVVSWPRVVSVTGWIQGGPLSRLHTAVSPVWSGLSALLACWCMTRDVFSS